MKHYINNSCSIIFIIIIRFTLLYFDDLKFIWFKVLMIQPIFFQLYIYIIKIAYALIRCLLKSHNNKINTN